MLKSLMAALEREAIMIELLGPSGVGKTTIVDAVALQLRKEGYLVRTISWKRNRLLSRSLNRGLRAIRSWLSPAPQSHLATALMTLLPPRNPLWSMRLRGYFGQLWELSFTDPSVGSITVLDQGFVQFICSLALLSGIDDRHQIAKALACIPKPDLVIRVDAPLHVVEARVRERHRHLGWVQRWLELDLQTSSHQMKIIGIVSDILSNKRQGLITVDSSDPIIEKILTEIRARTKVQ